MLRRVPLNYLVTAAVGGLLWVLAGVLLGNHLGDTVELVSPDMTIERFLAHYRTALTVAVVIGVLACALWYWRGGRESAASELPAARRLWTALLVGLVVVAAAILIVLVVVLREERVSGGQYVLIFVALSALTWLLFWACTFLLSPRAVEYVPVGKR